MPATGLFNIHRAEATALEDRGQSVIAKVNAECLNCHKNVCAVPGEGLEPVQGGVVLTCAACGSRQGISNQLFADVTNQV